jgi:2,4-dienoyl-CoA reductase-like NADH-dependent reductase (Old Yellow Enzyme family)
MPVTSLFTPGTIGPMTVPNRIVRSATHEGITDGEGQLSPRYAPFLEALAKGGVGLVVTGHLYVREDGRVNRNQAGIDHDRFVPRLRGVGDAVHRHGAGIVAQISHAGANADPLTSVALAPSAVADPGYRHVPVALAAEDVPALVQAFVAAALRVKAAGLDGVQLHAAHGYLLSQFLSPSRNVRDDAYGGSAARRARLLGEICAGIRRAAGPGFAVLVKMNGADLVEGGLELADATAAAAVLVASGVDAIEVSGGLLMPRLPPAIFRTKIDRPADEGYFRALARAVKARVNVPVISVGGWRSPQEIDRALAAGDADFVSMSRPLVREPDLVRRWRAGDDRPATCTSCNRCLKATLSEAGLCCPVLAEG